jgi:hypothetical protein
MGGRVGGARYTEGRVDSWTIGRGADLKRVSHENQQGSKDGSIDGTSFKVCASRVHHLEMAIKPFSGMKYEHFSSNVAVNLR